MTADAAVGRAFDLIGKNQSVKVMSAQLAPLLFVLERDLLVCVLGKWSISISPDCQIHTASTINLNFFLAI